jgi:hypothetical protein
MSHRPPAPGDLFVFAETADFPVEWAVLSHGPGEDGRLLAVPADTHPLAGSADVEVLAGEPAGPLCLRCRFGLWLDAARFDPARYTGTLPPDAVARALDLRAALESGEPQASPLAYEAEADPEYEDWVREVLAPAHAALAQPVALSAPDRPARPLPFVLRRWWTSLGNPYALAASILLLVTLSLTGGVFWQSGRISDLATGQQRTERELRQEKERLTEELRQAEAAHGREIAERDREAERQRAEDRQRIDDLESRLKIAGRISRGRPLINAPFVNLEPLDPVRGEPDAVPLPPGGSYLFVLLTITDLRVFPEYRLEIRDRDSGHPFWATRGLHKTGDAEVSVALPRDLLPPGSYRLRLYGIKDGKVEDVGEYELYLFTPTRSFVSNAFDTGPVFESAANPVNRYSYGRKIAERSLAGKDR